MVHVQNVSKVYPLYRRAVDRVLESLPFAPHKLHTDFWALRDVSMDIERGEIAAFIGPNGSGKSTLLQIVSGILQPTRGRVVTRGRISALLELGAGFNAEFTGRENVYLNGEIMGLAIKEIDRVFPKIRDFAGIGDFMDRPVKEYSSGMYVRLAFATAIHVDPEILIVDEALAVGDAVFANRCMQKFEELRQRRITILFVSHDLGLVKRLAQRAYLLVGGHVRAEGAPAEVVNRYVGLVLEQGQREENDNRDLGSANFRHGDRASEILTAKLMNERGHETATLLGGETARVRVRARFHKAVSEPVVGILIRNRLGIDVYGTNTKLEQHPLGSFEAGDEVEVEIGFPCFLSEQDYTLTVATQYWEGLSQDWLDDMLSFRVADPKGSSGLVNLPTTVQAERFRKELGKL
jgi:lipopolysaccharide transport system ATP-binding protein